MKNMGRKFKYAIGIILYQPTKNEIVNILNYLDIFDKIYIYDNSDKSNEEKIYSVLKNGSYEYFFNGNNEGISIPYNIMLNKARYNYEYFLMMDQDSIYTKENIEIMINEIEENNDINIAIYCPNILFNNSKIKEISSDQYVNFCITSGSFIDVQKFIYLGGYDENLFIDGVDREYCIRVIKKKYKIKKIYKSVMKQELGSKGKNILGVFEHSGIRNYYIYRNRLYIINKHPDKFIGLTKFKYFYLSQVKQIMSIILFEKSKINKLFYLFEAKKDYKNQKFGKYSEGNK